MSLAIHPPVNRESLLKVLDRFSWLAKVTPCRADVVERRCHVWMFLPIHPFNDGKSLLIVLNSFIMLAKGVPCRADVIESCCHVRMPITIHPPINRESPLEVLNRLSCMPHSVPDITQQIESLGNCTFAGVPQPFRDLQPVFNQLLSFLVISLIQTNLCNTGQCPSNSQFIPRSLCQFQSVVIAFYCFLMLRPFPVEVAITEIKRY